MCKYISYNGITSKEVLANTELFLCKFSRQDSRDTSLGRSMDLGIRTYSKLKRNNYNANFENDLVLNISLMKTDMGEFTESEKRACNVWLTKNRTANRLYILDDEDVTYSRYYIGIFTEVNEHYGDGMTGYELSFTCVSPEYYETKQYTISGGLTTSITLDTDSTVYPYIEIHPSSDTMTIENITDQIVSYITDENGNCISDKSGDILTLNVGHVNKMTLYNLDEHTTIYVDCENKNIRNSNGKNVPLSRYGIDKVYWMKLFNGKNKILVNGGSITLTCEVSRRGGVIDEL